MLRGLPKLLLIREPRQDVAELGFTKGTMSAHAGVIANTHQKGHTYKVTAASRRSIAPSDAGTNRQASKAQARKLRELGFKRPGKRKRSYRSASLGWITGNLNYAQARVQRHVLELQFARVHEIEVLRVLEQLRSRHALVSRVAGCVFEQPTPEGLSARCRVNFLHIDPLSGADQNAPK